jgi:hypothetical protein
VDTANVARGAEEPERTHDSQTSGRRQVSFASFDAAMRRFQHECNVPAIRQTPAVAFTQHTARLFAALDRDGDGDISWSDLTAVLASSQQRWKLWTFGCIFCGYFCYYLTRGSFTFVAPFLRTDLGWSLQEVRAPSSQRGVQRRCQF